MYEGMLKSVAVEEGNSEMPERGSDCEVREREEKIKGKDKEKGMEVGKQGSEVAKVKVEAN